MPHDTPVRLRYGPLTVYVQSLAGCPELQPYVQSLPPDEPVVWLDSARHHPVTGRWSLVGCEPWMTCSVRGNRIELCTSAATHVYRAHPLDALRQVLRRYRIPPTAEPHARAMALMGFLGYELNGWIERLPEPQSAGGTVPDMLWFGMRLVVLLDHVEERGWLVSLADPHAPEPLARRDALEALHRARERLTNGSPHRPVIPCVSSVLAPTTSRETFEAMVAQVLEYIRAGEIFQANVSQRFTASWRGEPRVLYEALRRINPSPFACFLSSGDLAVVSCSPERLVRVQEGRVETRPIAGTRPRGTNPEEDAINSLELLLSEKERAEHIMLVDLERNDLGRVCEAGSVSVDELMVLEGYSHVLHIVSNISGTVRRGVDAIDIIRAAFPGGTITGCPKVRCMEILREVEPVRRGVYTGSVGYLGFDGTIDLNIAIRTMVIQGSQLSFHVGAGIVADSVPDREYRETLDKSRALDEALRAVSAPSSSPYAATR